MKKGIVYFIQPAELVGTNRYKIGCSRNSDLERIKCGYKKGTRNILIYECVEPFILERKIKDIFNNKFKTIAGKEYYEGDENLMFEEFSKLNNSNSIVNIKKDKNKNENKNENKDENKKLYSCKPCDFKTHRKNDYSKHIKNMKIFIQCMKCNFATNKEVNYKRHLLTQKHIKLNPVQNNNLEKN